MARSAFTRRGRWSRGGSARRDFTRGRLTRGGLLFPTDALTGGVDPSDLGLVQLGRAEHPENLDL